MNKIIHNIFIQFIVGNMLIGGLIALIIGILVSLGLQNVFSFNILEISDTSYFRYFLNLLLAVGLYAGVYGIDIQEFKKNKKIILKVISLGVILKSVFIGGVFYLITGNILGFLLGIVIAQIDPLSVSHLIGKNKRLSKKAEVIFRSWSSFDDPITVLLLVYIMLPIVGPLIESGGDFTLDYFGYFIELGANFVFVAVMYKLFKKFKNNEAMLPCLFLLSLNFLVVSFFFSVYLGLLLSVALIALFIRPDIEKYLDTAVTIAFYLSICVLGMFLVNGVNIYAGLLIGCLVFTSQIGVTFLFGRDFSLKDKMYVGFGQQNGITSIILALFLERYFPGQIVSTIGVAILCITVLYFIANYFLDMFFQKRISK